MGRQAKLPDHKQREVAFEVLARKMSRREAARKVEEEGYPPVSDIAIQRYVEKYREEYEMGNVPHGEISDTRRMPTITKQTATIQKTVVSQDMLRTFDADIGRIDDAIRTHYDYINILKLRVEDFEKSDEPSAPGRADMLRKRVTECFIALVKAEVSKIELLRDHVMMTQSTEVKTNVATDIQSAYERGYKTGLDDAEKKFSTLMEEYRKRSVAVESPP